jgi:tRNA(Arg) A34 adenosine deaminase TadA
MLAFPKFVLTLPSWIAETLADAPQTFLTVKERMNFVIRLSCLNVEHGTGGPFGAAIFDMQKNTLFAAGVNLVVSSRSSIAHAEIVALVIAQQRLGYHDLSSIEGTTYELVSSAEPCAMCLGALPWAGIRSLVCGARDEDARRIGFDEGAKLQLREWILALEQRGISVTRDICRDAAVEVLNQYKQHNGIIYNSHSNRIGRVDSR